ncbi:hypothetical protein DVH24_028891 [Malus domestica]|uniref:GYF domain-containing protein n=1 Tax=Malus domestica TaxID=3750 RepID=A0A498HTT7_MALDO|nr:hypothetical protein DVH24_028891 [Malus domestica]
MDSFSWMAEPSPGSGPSPGPSPGSRPIPSPFRGSSKRTRSRKQQDFDLEGWGSRRLFQFLESIGRDTTHKISQYDVESIVTDYVKQHQLQHPTKKKRIVCDDRLFLLFGRKTIGRVKIYELLQQHFADNMEDDSSSDDDSDGNDRPLNINLNVSAEQVEEDGDGNHRKQKKKKAKRFTEEGGFGLGLGLGMGVGVGAGVGVGPPKSCFAAVIPENIKLVYLKRSLVEHLLLNEEKENEGKVVGSFVRIKSDPNDYLQKNSHLLLQVTALNKPPAASSSSGVLLLCLSGLALVKEVPISQLSNDNFTQEECEDLRQRIKEGLLKSLTVVELQQKVQILHEDIMKHTPDEQARLLREVPEVIADELEIEDAPKDCADEIQEENRSSTRDIIKGASEAPVCDIPAEKNLITWTATGIISEAKVHGISWQEWKEQPTEPIKTSNGEKKYGTIDTKGFQELVGKLVQTSQEQPTESIKRSNGENKHGSIDTKGLDKLVQAPQVIDLSDDEDEEQCDGERIPADQLGSSIWHYFDPQGNIQGPFSIALLKGWSDADYFPPDFKIWKAGQSSNQAVLLQRILQQNYPNKVAKH